MYRGVTGYKFQKNINVFLSLEIGFFITNGAHTDEMMHMQHFTWVSTVCQSMC